MFLGNWTKDHFSSREGPILLWSSFLVSLHFHFNPFFPLVSFQFAFLIDFFLGSLSRIFALLLLTHISRRGELNNFWNSIFPHIFLLTSGIRSLIAREEISLRLCSPVWRVILFGRLWNNNPEPYDYSNFIINIYHTYLKYKF